MPADRAVLARQSSGSGPPGGGTLSVTSASATRSSARETTASIVFHTSETRGSSPGAPHPSDSNRASTATASLADALACRRAFSLSDSRCARSSSSVVISRSSSSRASSMLLASRCRTVATRVASWRGSEWRRIREADAVMP